MKTSELRSEIKDYIYEILSEEANELTEAGENTAIIKFKNGPTAAVDYKIPTELKQYTDNADVTSVTTGTGARLKEAIKKIKMMKEGDDKKQKVAALKNIIKEKIAKTLNEFEDLSVKNNYLDKDFYDPTTGEYSEDKIVDGDKVFKDLLKTKAYYKSRLPLYHGKPLTDYQIDSLIDTFAANERDIMSSDPTGPGNIERMISKWKNADIDDLTDYFVDFVNGVSDDGNYWDEWEFYDVTKNKYSGKYPSRDKWY